MRKKLITLFTTLTMVVLFAGINVIPVNGTAIKWCVGDVNRDNLVDAVDASIIMFYYTAQSTGKNAANNVQIYTVAADVNHDSKIDAIDASLIMKMYSMASVYGFNRFEEIEVSDLSRNDVVELKEFAKWGIFTKREIGRENLYREKPYLITNEQFVISEKYSDEWYGIYINNNFQEELYIKINKESLQYFEKIGSITAMPTTTTTSTTSTTTTTTTSTTSTTTTTTTSTTSTTSTTTTTTSTTTTTTTWIDEQKYSNWDCINFSGIYWNFRSSTSIEENNILGQIKNNETFFIKQYVGNNWYEICRKSIFENLYIYIENNNEYLFNTMNTENYYFNGDCWNVRNERNINDDSNIVGQLEFGDIVAVLDYYDDGWARVITNKVEGYVYFQPFEKLN